MLTETDILFGKLITLSFEIENGPIDFLTLEVNLISTGGECGDYWKLTALLFFQIHHM